MRSENQRMKHFLSINGITAIPKWLPGGSLKRCWRLYGKGQQWTPELTEKLTNLGFVDFDHEPLDQYSGNGGMFQVFIRGHEEFLT